jgi:organic hydroperoxide reductase OsmC/OhrA
MGEGAEATRVSLELQDGFRFLVDLGDTFERLAMDEPEPLGEGSGPNASAVLGAAVGNCLSASLLYCLRRAHIEVTGLRTEVEVVPARNAKGRLRIASLQVRLHPELVAGGEGRVARCLELFEDFCVVTESVRQGIEVGVIVDALPTLAVADPDATGDQPPGSAG